MANYGGGTPLASALSDFSITLLPEQAPTWKGVFPFTTAAMVGETFIVSIPREVPVAHEVSCPDDSRIMVPVPSNGIDGGGPRTQSIELTIVSLSSNGKTMDVSGVFTELIEFFSPCAPTIIAPDAEFVSREAVQEYADDAEVFYGEFFDEALDNLLGNKFNLSCSVQTKGPLLTEAAPVIVLNGSKAEQLSALLSRISPTNLWGQKVQWWINPFKDLPLMQKLEDGSFVVGNVKNGSKAKLIVTVPKVDNVLQLELPSILPTEWSQQSTVVSVPATLYAIEDVSSAYRTRKSIVHGAKAQSGYSYSTTSNDVFDSAESGGSSVSTSVTGSNISQGGLIYDETLDVTTTTTRNVSVDVTLGSGTVVHNTQTATEKIHSKFNSVAAYSYLLGPPYKVTLGSDSLLQNKHPAEGSAPACVYFSKSGHGSRRAVAMENSGEIEADYLCSSEGALPLQKKVTTTEVTTVVAPGAPDALSGIPTTTRETVTVVTTTDENYAYDPDTHVLLLNGVHKLVTIDKILRKEETLLHRYSPIAEDKTAEFTSKTVIEYDEEGEVVSAPPTAITVSVTEGAGSPVDVPSSFESAVKYCAPPEKISLSSGGSNIFGQGNTGVVYTTILCWVIGEIQKFIKKYFCTEPVRKEQISFSSYTVDPYALIGRNVTFSGDTALLNKGSIYTEQGLTAVQASDLILSDEQRLIVGVTITFEENNRILTTVATCSLLEE